MDFIKMERTKNDMFINSKKAFSYDLTIDYEYFVEAFEFAYSMTFGMDGQHRNHRSGGTHHRRNGEIFCDTLQGKLSEYAIFQSLGSKYNLQKPDIECYELGKWDRFDFSIGDNIISVKSTKHFGNLLLLETKDWNREGQYIPNGNEKIDYTFLVRLEDSITSMLKQHKLYYSDNIERGQLWDILCDLKIHYDIPGYITKDDLIYLIDNDFVIKKGEMLNGVTRMDADNYYCQAGCMRYIDTFMEE